MLKVPCDKWAWTKTSGLFSRSEWRFTDARRSSSLVTRNAERKDVTLARSACRRRSPNADEDSVESWPEVVLIVSFARILTLSCVERAEPRNRLWGYYNHERVSKYGYGLKQN